MKHFTRSLVLLFAVLLTLAAQAQTPLTVYSVYWSPELVERMMPILPSLTRSITGLLSVFVNAQDPAIEAYRIEVRWKDKNGLLQAPWPLFCVRNLEDLLVPGQSSQSTVCSARMPSGAAMVSILVVPLKPDTSQATEQVVGH